MHVAVWVSTVYRGAVILMLILQKFQRTSSYNRALLNVYCDTAAKESRDCVIYAFDTWCRSYGRDLVPQLFILAKESRSLHCKGFEITIILLIYKILHLHVMVRCLATRKM
jgi:hypothetical protein